MVRFGSVWFEWHVNNSQVFQSAAHVPQKTNLNAFNTYEYAWRSRVNITKQEYVLPILDLIYINMYHSTRLNICGAQNIVKQNYAYLSIYVLFLYPSLLLYHRTDLHYFSAIFVSLHAHIRRMHDIKNMRFAQYACRYSSSRESDATRDLTEHFMYTQICRWLSFIFI